MSAVDPGNYSEEGPFGVVADSSKAMLNILESFASLLDLPDLVKTSKEIVSLPPEQRFTESVDRYKDLLTDSEGQQPNQLEKRLPDVKKEIILPKLLSALQDILITVEERILQGVLVDRDEDRGYLVLALYLEKARQIFADIEFYRESESLKMLLSTGVALYSRILLIALREQTEITEDTLRDIVRADYYRSKAVNREIGDDPEKLPMKIIEKKISLDGAVLAYSKLDISVSRGAELANVSTDEFEAALVEKGIRPRYGPANDEELFGDDDWMSAGATNE